MDENLQAYLKSVEDRITSLEAMKNGNPKATKSLGWVQLVIFFTATGVLLLFNFAPALINVLWGDGAMSQTVEANITSQSSQIFVSWSTLLGMVFGGAAAEAVNKRRQQTQALGEEDNVR